MSRTRETFVLPLLFINGETYDNPNVPTDTPQAYPPEIVTGAEVRVTLDGKTIVDSEVDDLTGPSRGTRFCRARSILKSPRRRMALRRR